MPLFLWLIVLPLFGAVALFYVLAFFSSDLVRLGLFFLSPFVIFFAFAFTLHFIWDPNPGCSYDCTGRLVYLFAGGATLIGAELGVLAGWIDSALRARKRRAKTTDLNAPSA
jgi:hypothetical protein